MGVYSNNQSKGQKRRLIFIVTICILILILGSYTYFKWFYLPSVTVQQFTWVKQGEYPAALVFNESIVTAPQSGKIYFESAEGDTLQTDDVALSLINTVEADQIQLEIAKVEAQIAGFTIQDGTDQLAVISTKEEAALELRTSIQNYSVYLGRKDEASIKSAFENMEVLTDQYYNCKSSSDTELSNYQELNDQLISLQIACENCSQEIYAKSSGVISYTFDGLESILTPASLPLSDYRWFDQALSTTVMKHEATVSMGDQIMRIIVEDQYDLIISVPVKESMEYQYAEDLVIKYGDQVLSGEFLDLITDQNQNFFYFRVNQELPSLDRRIEISMSTEEITCYEVPQQALVNEDGRVVVYCKEGLTKIQKEVDVLLNLADTVLIKGLHDGDQVIKDAQGMGR